MLLRQYLAQNIGKIIAVQLILFIVYLVSDAIMLKSLANFYKKNYDLDSFNRIPAFFVWLLYPMAIVYFTRGSVSSWKTGFDGALLGLTVYGVYHLTSAATFPQWHGDVAVWDTIWGMIMTTILALLGKQLYTTIQPNS